MIAHVVERARATPGVSQVLVATDDARIAAAVRAHGGDAVMTREELHFVVSEFQTCVRRAVYNGDKLR